MFRSAVLVFIFAAVSAHAGVAIKYAVIDSSGIVQNVVLWDGVSTWISPPGTTVTPVPSTGYQPQPGDSYTGGAFVHVVAAPVVPASVSAAQIRLALSHAGLLAAVNAGVGTASTDVQTYWQYSTTFERNNPLLEQMAASLGLSDAQVDAVFVAAAAF